MKLYRSYLKITNVELNGPRHFDVQATGKHVLGLERGSYPLGIFLNKTLYLYLLCLCLTNCPSLNQGGGGRGRHCSQYTLNDRTKQWTDALGNPVSCSIADNNKIFPYLPDTGCDTWKEFFKADPTVRFVEIPIRVGSSSQNLLQTYCVKQQYVELDNSGQVLLLDQGSFCLKKYAEKEKEYVFSNCAGVYRKNPNSQKTDPQTGDKPQTTGQTSKKGT